MIRSTSSAEAPGAGVFEALAWVHKHLAKKKQDGVKKAHEDED